MNHIMKADGRPLRLYGLTEVAGVLGIQKQPAQRALKRPGAPAPVAELAMGAVWDADDIDAWATTRRTRPGRAPGVKST
ncbi:hypothetical protein ACIRLA_46265 [Streptomyces sp. NPDC102364]|uniref:hypothetical protein n=1 Tax=Streptomyces sp. NPDC102364 TaxID=3366161 RepID=UPI0037FAA4B9